MTSVHAYAEPANLGSVLASTQPTTRGGTGLMPLPMPTITRERTRPDLRLVEASDLGGALVVARPDGGGQVLVVVDQDTPAPMLRGLARVMLRDSERRHLSRFLNLRRKR